VFPGDVIDVPLAVELWLSYVVAIELC
jgi:hypothetical protein